MSTEKPIWQTAGRKPLTAAQTAAFLRTLTPEQRDMLAKPGQRLA